MWFTWFDLTHTPPYRGAPQFRPGQDAFFYCRDNQFGNQTYSQRRLNRGIFTGTSGLAEWEDTGSLASLETDAHTDQACLSKQRGRKCMDQRDLLASPEPLREANSTYGQPWSPRLFSGLNQSIFCPWALKVVGMRIATLGYKKINKVSLLCSIPETSKYKHALWFCVRRLPRKHFPYVSNELLWKEHIMRLTVHKKTPSEKLIHITCLLT